MNIRKNMSQIGMFISESTKREREEKKEGK